MLYKTADHLFVDAIKKIDATPLRTIYGFSGTLESALHCFTWNKHFNMNPIRAYGELLYLLSFEKNEKQAKAFNPELAIGGEYIENSFSLELRHQLVTVLCELDRNLWNNNMILSAWRGIEDLHLGYFNPHYEELKPMPLLNLQYYWCGKKLNVICNYKTLNAFDLPYEIFKMSSLLSLVAGFRGIPVGTVRINATEMESRNASVKIMLNDLNDIEKPLQVDDSVLTCEPELAIMKLEDATITEQVMREEKMNFADRLNELNRYGECTTLSSALSVCYLRQASPLLKHLRKINADTVGLATGVLTRSEAISTLSASLQPFCDKRVIERVVGFLTKAV